MSDLCTLAQVKAYMGPSAPTNADGLLQSLITAYSQKLATYCSRNFDLETYTEVRNGSGGYRLTLINGPVQSITSVTVGGQAIPPAGSSTSNSGWRMTDLVGNGDGRMLLLQGFRFPKGYGNASIVYAAGYPPGVVTGELWNIPVTPGPYTITVAKALTYTGGDTVSYTGGAALTRVAGNPAVGQYSITSAGVISFNAADQGRAVTIGYNVLGYPADLTEALIELVVLRYKARDWTGYVSKTLATETVTFSQADMPPTIKGTIDNYQVALIPS